MKILKTAIMSALVFSASVNAGFKTNHWQDEMNDTKVYTKYTSVKSSGYNNYQYFGFECRIKDNKSVGKISLQFDGDEGVATPNSFVDIKLRVDKGKVYELQGRTYSNSYRGGFINVVPDTLYSELKAGSKLHMKIYNHNRLEVSESFSLSGSTVAINYVASKCGVSLGERDELAAKKREINTYYDKQIAKLNKERKKKLAALK